MSVPEKNHYATLEVSSIADFDEIQKSYLRLKNTYVSSNQALYSLMSAESIQVIIDQIEGAYEVLSNPASRIKYDETFEGNAPIGIDQTDFSSTTTPESPTDLSYNDESPQNIADWLPDPMEASQTQLYPIEDPTAYKSYSQPLKHELQTDYVCVQAKNRQSEVESILSGEDISDGRTYQMIREHLSITKKEIFEQTSLSDYYLKCIEENDFDLLPQKVYVKGFLKGYLNYIGVPDVQTALQAYLSRLEFWWNNKKAFG